MCFIECTDWNKYSGMILDTIAYNIWTHKRNFHSKISRNFHYYFFFLDQFCSGVKMNRHILKLNFEIHKPIAYVKHDQYADLNDLKQ